MKIETAFNAGDKVVFLHNGSVYRRTITKVTVESVKRHGENDAHLVTYFFDLAEKQGIATNEIYKYEGEVAATKEELIALHREL